jgi:hypothetical protein
MNYPRVWLAPTALGLGQEATPALAMLLNLAFFVALLALIGPVGIGAAVVYIAALTSPAVLLAIERGNTDLAMFALVCGSVIVSGRLAGLAILVGTVLKLYPIAAILSVPGRTRILVFAGAVAYGIVTLADIQLNLAETPRTASRSYGLTTNATVLFPDMPTVVSIGILVVVGAFAVLIVALRGERLRGSHVAQSAFIAGAMIFGATYILGPNWNYRLVFLLLTLPLALELARLRRPALLLLVGSTLWLSSHQSSPVFPASQLAQYLTAVVIAAILASEALGGWRERNADRGRLAVVSSPL